MSICPCKVTIEFECRVFREPLCIVPQNVPTVQRLVQNNDSKVALVEGDELRVAALRKHFSGNIANISHVATKLRHVQIGV